MAQYRGYKGGSTQTYRKLYGYKGLLAWQAADEWGRLSSLPVLAAHAHDIVITRNTFHASDVGVGFVGQSQHCGRVLPERTGGLYPLLRNRPWFSWRVGKPDPRLRTLGPGKR